MEFSTITLTTAEGDFAFLAGPKTALRIDSPGPHGMRVGARFSGFSGEADPSVDPPNLRSERITGLQLLRDVGEEPARDVLEVTLEIGDEMRKAAVPISTINAPPRPLYLDPNPVLNPPSKLILSGIPDAPYLRTTHDRVLSLSGLSAIEVTEPADPRKAAA